MLNLTTYRRNQFARLKDRLKSEGYDYTSALSLTSTAQIAQQARERSIAVDISSLISLLDSSGGKAGIVATFEALLYQMPKNTVFVADETAANKYAYEMRTIFDTVQPCDIDNNSEDQAVLSKENPKRLIDLDDSETKALLDQFACDLIGQDQFKGEFRKQVEIFRLFNSIGEQPILSLFLIGPSGVAKPRPRGFSVNCSPRESHYQRLTSATTAARTHSIHSSAARVATWAAKKASSQ